MVTGELAPRERQSVIGIFGATRTPNAALNGQPARKFLTVGQVQRALNGQLNKAHHRRAKNIWEWELDAAVERYEVEMLRDNEWLPETWNPRLAKT